jgi:[acyl-carrier-protein] S-malonyltransferase
MAVALLFPGQGSQYIGMGTKWLQKYPYIKQIYDRADSALGFSISKICFEGPDIELVKTEFTQPAILTTSIAMLEVLKTEKNIKFDYTAGHSLGEYSALVASGALKFEEAVKVVNIRGKLMQKAVPIGEGKMAAVIRCENSVLNENIKKVLASLNNSKLVLVPANYNSDDQTVVSGSAMAVDELVKVLKEQKIKAIPLNVSAPFHSPLMSSIVPAFSSELKKLNIQKLHSAYVSNFDAVVNRDSSVVFDKLCKQIPGSVLWTQTIKHLAESGVTKAIEVGSGKVLTGLCEKISGSFLCTALDQIEDLSALG